MSGPSKTQRDQDAWLQQTRDKWIMGVLGLDVTVRPPPLMTNEEGRSRQVLHMFALSLSRTPVPGHCPHLAGAVNAQQMGRTWCER
jgi:hypothetical protein